MHTTSATFRLRLRVVCNVAMWDRITVQVATVGQRYDSTTHFNALASSGGLQCQWETSSGLRIPTFAKHFQASKLQRDTVQSTKAVCIGWYGSTFYTTLSGRAAEVGGRAVRASGRKPLYTLDH